MMLWRLFSLLTIAVAVRPMMDGSSNEKVSVGKKFCRLKSEMGVGDCVEQDEGDKWLDVFCKQNGLSFAANGDCASTQQGHTCIMSEDKAKGRRFMVKPSSHLCKQ